MPVQASQPDPRGASSYASPVPAPPGSMPLVSNDLDDMTAGGSIGPDQARVRVLSCEYIAFDYNGTQRNDPVVAVRMNLSPLDGENEGKDFDAEWTTGGKISDFSIVNDGGALSPVGDKRDLHKNSNWFLFMLAFRDAAQFDTKLLNGPNGIRYLAGSEMIIRRIKQPDRAGLDAKNAKGQDKTYYTCLKVDKLPGESKPATRRAAPASTPTPRPAAAPAQAPASAPVVNGQAAPASTDYLSLITAALSSNGGSLPIADLPKAVFNASKALGNPPKTNHEMGQLAKSLVEDESRFYEVISENGLSWSLSDGVLAG